MPVNRYFNQTTHVPEQHLLEDLIVEAIQIHGHSAFYIPREDVDVDRLFGEDPLSTFTTAREIELYLKNAQSFAGQSEFISKFSGGLQIEDQATFLVAVRRFDEVMEGSLVRPREGDIIFIEMTPTNRYLFTIMFVENKEQLFQLGKLYTYELRCEIMNYSHERVQTQIPDINGVAERQAYTIDLALGAGTGTYESGELVYQGSSFLTAIASGTVAAYAANTLSVQNVTGAFANDVSIVGVTSGASYLPAGDTDTAPTAHDPIADNALLSTEQSGIIINRGSNPRLT